MKKTLQALAAVPTFLAPNVQALDKNQGQPTPTEMTAYQRPIHGTLERIGSPTEECLKGFNPEAYAGFGNPKLVSAEFRANIARLNAAEDWKDNPGFDIREHFSAMANAESEVDDILEKMSSQNPEIYPVSDMQTALKNKCLRQIADLKD